MKESCKTGLYVPLECFRSVTIGLPDKDWKIDKGERVDCVIHDEGVTLELTRDLTYTTSLSNVCRFFRAADSNEFQCFVRSRIWK